LIWILVLGLAAVAVVLAGVFVVPEWERVAVMRFGKLVGVVEPGIRFRIPVVDRIIRVDIRTQTLDLMGQQAITKDNISVIIDAVVFMVVEDPVKLILEIQDYKTAVSKYAQTAIRNIIGTYDLDALLESREEVAVKLKEEIDILVKEWGIDVTRAGLQDISLPPDMKRAFAVQAEAERESRATQIMANAELLASEKLRQAAENMKDPVAMQLRILSTINDISKDQSNTIILALPLETLKAAGVGGLAALASIRQEKYPKPPGSE